MKKLLTVLLAALLVISMSFSAFAADKEDGPSADHDPVYVDKEYTVNGEAQDELVPAEVLSFNVAAYTEDGWKNPDDSMITVDDLDTAKGLEIKISFPTFTKLGIYKYTVTENAGSVPGVTYDDTDILVVVYVVNETAGTDQPDSFVAYVGVFKEMPADSGEGGEGEEETVTVKIGGDPDPDTGEEPTGDAAFTNEYSVGTLTVDKKVSGNLSRSDKPFTITVTFAGLAEGNCPITYGDGEEITADNLTATIKLMDGESVVFENIPVGVTYTVEEDSTHTTGDINSDEGYSVNYVGTDLDEDTYTAEEDGQPEGAPEAAGEIAEAAEEDTVTVQNYKNTPVQTGIFLDSLPYILIGVAVIAVAVVMIIRKKRQSEEE